MDTKTINLRDLPEELVRRAKVCAVLHGMTLKDFVIHAISKAIEQDIPVTSALQLAAFTTTSKAKRRKKT